MKRYLKQGLIGMGYAVLVVAVLALIGTVFCAPFWTVAWAWNATLPLLQTSLPVMQWPAVSSLQVLAALVLTIALRLAIAILK